MNQPIENRGGKRGAKAAVTEEGEWNYLRQHLDRPRFLALPRVEYLSSQSFSTIGERITAWLAQRWRRDETSPARLVSLARLPLGPRQAITMVEADGARILVGSSTDGALTFHPLPGSATTDKIDTQRLHSGSQDADQAMPPVKARGSSNWDGALTQNPFVRELVSAPFAFQSAQSNSASVFSRPETAVDPIKKSASPAAMTASLQHKNRAGRRASLPSRISW